MSNSSTSRFLARSTLTAVVLALLGACGGADAPPNAQALDAQTASFLGQIAQAEANRPVRALATARDVNAKAVIDWAEYKFPELFKGAIASFDAVEFDGKIFFARIYNGPAGLRYLGVTTDGRIFGLGDFTNNLLVQFETVAFWTQQILADWSNFQPGGDGNSAPPGPLNGCAMASQQIFQVGNRARANYVTSGARSGLLNTEIVVEGPDTFDGKSAIRTSELITGTTTEGGSTTEINISNKRYVNALASGFTSELGSVSKVSVSGFTLETTTVYNPADLNGEFGLAQGQTFTKSSTITSKNEPIGGTSTSTFSRTYTFEAVENITVRGKTYNTCRYRELTPNTGLVTLTWYIVGKGIPARTEETETQPNGSKSVTLDELVSGDINGTAL